MARYRCQHCGVIADTENTTDQEWDDIAAVHLHGMYAWKKLKEPK